MEDTQKCASSIRHKSEGRTSDYCAEGENAGSMLDNIDDSAGAVELPTNPEADNPLS